MAPVRVRTGSRLSQMRFRKGHSRLSIAEHRMLHTIETLVLDANVERVGARLFAIATPLPAGKRAALAATTLSPAPISSVPESTTTRLALGWKWGAIQNPSGSLSARV